MVHLGSPELDFTLCRCACHGDCSLAGRVDGTGWPESCSCNKTLKMRADEQRIPARDRSINVFSMLGAGLDNGRRQRSARQGAAAQAKAGDTNDEVGAVIDEDWTRHGLVRLTGIARTSELSRITNPPGAIEQAVTTAKFFRDLAGARFRFRDHPARRPGDDEPGRGANLRGGHGR
jgi:hypothetical protein